MIFPTYGNVFISSLLFFVLFCFDLPCLCSTFHLEYPLVLSRFYLFCFVLFLFVCLFCFVLLLLFCFVLFFVLFCFCFLFLFFVCLFVCFFFFFWGGGLHKHTLYTRHPFSHVVFHGFMARLLVQFFTSPSLGQV